MNSSVSRVPVTPAAPLLLQAFARLLLAFAVTHTFSGNAWAQAARVDARVASVNGAASLSRSNSPATTIARGAVLLPGDAIDTTGGGSVTVELSDGSVVVVQPGSHVTLKDFAGVSSLRELLEVTLGRVWLRINHFGGRPNPYRINSPTASIAVRGTEFSVEVNARRDTQVVVYRGLVEVVSLVNPGQRALLEQGRGVIIRANQDIHFILPGQAHEFERRNEGQENSVQANSQAGRSGPYAGEEDDSPRETASTYRGYLASLSEIGQMPFYMRFMAFPDSHLDALDNPAYATEFTSAAGRMFLLPSFRGARGAEENQAAFGFGAPQPIDYTISPQGSFFIPVAAAQAVVGGGIAASHSGLQLFSADEGISLTGPLFPAETMGTRDSSASSASTVVTGSLAAARRFGKTRRTSIGAGLDLVRRHGSLVDLVTLSAPAGLTAQEKIQSASSTHQTLLKIGLTRDLGRGHKFGVLYRYGLISIDDAQRLHALNGAPQPLDATFSSGHSSGMGFRLRGPLTRRLFYGLNGSWLSLRLDDRQAWARGTAFQGNRVSRTALGGGLGFALSPRLVVSLDAAGGLSRARSLRREDATGNLLGNRSDGNRFMSLHGAVQADLWKQLFVSASFLALVESYDSNAAVPPDRFERIGPVTGVLPIAVAPNGRHISYFSDFGFGWRFNQHFLAQYLLSTDYGMTVPRHTLLLRYTFDLRHR